MKTVIEMAREATLLDSRDDWSSVPDEYREAINAFAELVRADEREACARFLESTNLAGLPDDTALHYARLLKGFAEGIRARSNT